MSVVTAPTNILGLIKIKTRSQIGDYELRGRDEKVNLFSIAEKEKK